MSYQDRLLKAIPGGAHTYSRGYDQYPTNAPAILSRGKGAYVYGADGSEFLDYGMALRAVNIGYAEPSVDTAAFEQMQNGNNLTRPSIVELEAAELLIDLVDSVDMVKFTKNGSTAVSAAVKLARAYTGKELVARCAEHPFFSYDDWFIGSTPVTRGIPKETLQQTKVFRYNDTAALESLLEQYPGQFACVVMEAAAAECPAISADTSGCCGQAPCKRHYRGGDAPANYLQQVERLCRKHDVVFILDEMITGFRWHLKGAQHFYNVTPDICTFGKAMANGYSVACVAGRREIMELGSIEFKGRERVFLLSTTHGAEMCGLGAFVATMKFLQEHAVVEHLWDYGAQLTSLMRRKAAEHGLDKYFRTGGAACSPYYLTMDATGANSLEYRTLFSQEMIRQGVLMPWLALSYRHGAAELAKTEHALEATFRIYRKALEEGVGRYLQGPVIQPVFRKHN